MKTLLGPLTTTMPGAPLVAFSAGVVVLLSAAGAFVEPDDVLGLDVLDLVIVVFGATAADVVIVVFEVMGKAALFKVDDVVTFVVVFVPFAFSTVVERDTVSLLATAFGAFAALATGSLAERGAPTLCV